MAIRLEQMHPAVVHLPIALLPLAVGADVVGRVTGKESYLSFGQKAICVAAAGAVAAVATGLIAGEEVNAKGASHDTLITHRNLNVVATLVVSGMAIWRVRHRQPNAAYLGAGVAGVGLLACTAYLGGKLVYDIGVGVEPAKGVYRTDAPALKSGQLGSFLGTAATDFVHGVQHMVAEVAKGRLIPTITTAFREPQPTSGRQQGETPE